MLHFAKKRAQFLHVSKRGSSEILGRGYRDTKYEYFAQILLYKPVLDNCGTDKEGPNQK